MSRMSRVVRQLFPVIAFVVPVLLWPGSGVVQAASPSSARLTPVVRAVQSVLPSVANIGTEEVVRRADLFAEFMDQFFNRHSTAFRKESRPKWRPLGSGVCVCASGLVVTNHHVVSRASGILVRLLDGRTCSARMVAYDVPNDLALLKLEGDFDEQPLKAIDFALPDDLLLGETLVAVGYPFGLGHTVTEGVLSATNRSLTEGRVTFHDILQTDAAINPGNSGGPLVNLDGHLIGLNIAIRPGAEGIGFAVPAGRIEDVLAHWLVPAQFSVGFCGFVPKTVPGEDGLTVVAGVVTPGSPAAEAGLQPGERITTVNGQAVDRALAVGRMLWSRKPGDTIELVVEGGKRRRITVGEMGAEALIERRLGLRLQELTRPLAKAMGVPESLHGLVISQVTANSELDGKVRRGDIVMRVGNADTATREQLSAALADVPPGSAVDAVFLIEVQNARRQTFLRPFAIRVPLH